MPRTSATARYEYRVSNQQYNDLSPIDKKDLLRHRVGEVIRIAYLPEDLGVSRPEFNMKRGRWDFIVLGCIGALFGSLCLLVLTIKKSEYIKLQD